MQALNDSLQFVVEVLESGPHPLELLGVVAVILTLFVIAYYTYETHQLRKAAERQIDQSERRLVHRRNSSACYAKRLILRRRDTLL